MKLKRISIGAREDTAQTAAAAIIGRGALAGTIDHCDGRAELDEVACAGADLAQTPVAGRVDFDIDFVGLNLQSASPLCTAAPSVLSQRRMRTSSVSSLEPRRGMVTGCRIVYNAGAAKLSLSELSLSV